MALPAEPVVAHLANEYRDEFVDIADQVRQRSTELAQEAQQMINDAQQQLNGVGEQAINAIKEQVRVLDLGS
jgi:F0F1-type ATP synthase membrane subunit b/b'